MENLLFGGDEPLDINAMRLTSRECAYSWYAKYTDKKSVDLTLPEVTALRSRVQGDIAASASGTTITKTHSPAATVDGQHLINFEVTAGVIYIMRNPLDVCVSLAAYWGKSLDTMIDDLACDALCGEADEKLVTEYIGSWASHVLSWTELQEGGILVLRYEDLERDPMHHFARLAEFMTGAPADRSQVRKAIDFSAFDRLQAQEGEAGFKDYFSASSKFFRTGRSGEGRRLLSASQIDRVIAKNASVMEKFGYLP